MSDEFLIRNITPLFTFAIRDVLSIAVFSFTVPRRSSSNSSKTWKPARRIKGLTPKPEKNQRQPIRWLRTN